MGIIVFELFTNSCFQNNGAGDPKSTLLSVWPGEIIFFFDFLVCSSNCTCSKISLRNALRFEGERLVPFFDNATQI